MPVTCALLAGLPQFSELLRFGLVMNVDDGCEPTEEEKGYGNPSRVSDEESHHDGGYEPINSEPPYLDMYICNVCQRTYHWKCMK
eukprot:453001-Pelagomonas_calceolata.AAC.3